MIRTQVIGNLGKDCTTNQVAPYLRKGQQVFVEGAPDLRTYTRNDGSAGATLTLNVRSIQLLGASQRDDEDEGAVSKGASLADAGVAMGSDDLPF